MAGTRASTSALTTSTTTVPSKRRAPARPITTATATKTTQSVKRARSPSERGVWSAEEHDKFLIGIKLFPEGPWKSIAEQVGTRSARQVQTHAQKYYEKVARRLRGLRKDRKKLVRPEHRLDDDMMKLCNVATYDVANISLGPIGRGSLGLQLAARTVPLSSLTIADNDTPNDLKCEPLSPAMSSPVSIDTVPSGAFQDRSAFEHGGATHAAEPFPLELPQSFLSLLIDTVDSSSNIATPINSSSIGDDDECMSTAESFGSANDVTDIASLDDLDSLADLDDHYLDFLMDVLETDEQEDRALSLDFLL